MQRHSNMANLACYPALAIPNGFYENGSPATVTFMARPFGEAELIAVAKAYQDAAGFHLKHPARYGLIQCGLLRVAFYSEATTVILRCFASGTPRPQRAGESPAAAWKGCPYMCEASGSSRPLLAPIVLAVSPGSGRQLHCHAMCRLGCAQGGSGDVASRIQDRTRSPTLRAKSLWLRATFFRH